MQFDSGMKKFLFGFLMSFFLLFDAQAQKVLLEEHVGKDTTEPFFGPNLKHFMHFDIGYGFVVGNSNVGSQIEYGRSSSFLFGLRYKRKINNYYSLGFSLDYYNVIYRLKQDSSKILPDKNLHDKEFLKTNNFNLELYNRFNFDRRGNYMGKYIDLGFYGNLPFSSSHQFTDDKITQNARKTKVINSELKYLNTFNYGVSGRLGFNRLVFYVNFRLSEMFKKSVGNDYKSGFSELPRAIVGIQLGLFQ